MTGPTPYVLFPGTAREALMFYGDVFGSAVQLHTFAEFNRADGPADAIAHGYLTGGPVALSGADVSGDERPVRSEGMMLALLGTAAPSTLRTWFARLSEGARWWTTCRRGRGAHPTGKSSTVTVSTGSSGSRATRAAESLIRESHHRFDVPVRPMRRQQHTHFATPVFRCGGFRRLAGEGQALPPRDRGARGCVRPTGRM